MQVRWLGHATVELRAGGLTVLTDPLVTERVAHLRRRVPPPTGVHADVVLISHVHMDHLHRPSLRQVVARSEGRPTQVVVPKGAGHLVRGMSPLTDVREVVPGERLVVERPTGTIALTVTPARHADRRGPHSRVRAQPVGYVIDGDGQTAYFAGDTDLFDEMRELPRVDTALLPIWGWGPSLGPGHLDPGRAATAVTWLDPAVVVPIHWGTYSPVRLRPGAPAWLATPVDAFREALDAHAAADRLCAMPPGGATPHSAT